MLILVDPHSGVPVYRQLMDQIKFHVTSGLMSPGDELPSTRALSAELAINPMTVSKAFSLLEREGVLERRPGLPLVVAALDGRTARARRLDHLRQALGPVVTTIRQLGVSREEALATLSALLEDTDIESKE